MWSELVGAVNWYIDASVWLAYAVVAWPLWLGWDWIGIAALSFVLILILTGCLGGVGVFLSLPFYLSFGFVAAPVIVTFFFAILAWVLLTGWMFLHLVWIVASGFFGLFM